MSDDNDVKRPISLTIDEAVSFAKEVADRKQEEAIEKIDEAKNARFAAEVLDAAAPFYKSLYDSPLSRDMYPESAISGEYAWNKMHDEYRGFLAGENPTIVFASIASTAASLDSTVRSVASLLPNYDFTPVKVRLKPPFILAKTDYHGTADRLRNLDKNLANTFCSVWVTIESFTPDKERIALGQMRQTYDHLMGILAPDDEVRSSPYWRKKDAVNPKKIHRRERLHFVANYHVKNQKKRDLVIASIDLVLSSYDDLNALHKRDKLDPKISYETIKNMHRIIVDLLDAMEK